MGQQFRISENEDGSIRIEYPPSFDGAYLFVEATTNLADQAWETVDYTQVELVAGDSATYSPPLGNNAAAAGTNAPAEVPYIITTEYIEAVMSGEIEQAEWSAGTV